MNGIRAILGRELLAYFLSPLAYIVAALLLIVNGITFASILSFLNDPRAGIGAPLELFFGQTVFFWLVLLFVTPVLTMRLISEERRSGTIEILMTAPVTEAQVVLGKFFAAFVFYAFLWFPTLSYAGILAYYHEVDWGPVASGYLGILGIGAVFLSIGMMATAFARSQLVAAILTFALLMALFTLGLLEMLANSGLLKAILGYVNMWQHVEEFARGIVDTRRLVYYASTTGLFLFLATRAFAVRKWR